MSPTPGQDPEVECRLVLQHSDFVMQNHRVHGVSVMPGVTFLDIVLRILQSQGFDVARAELRNVLFHEAVATTEGHDREIRVVVSPPADGLRLVTAESRWRRDGEPISPYRRNFEAELAFRDVPEPPAVDLDALRRSAARTTDMDDMYARARAERIVHGDAMRCFGQLHHGAGELLAELALDAESAALDEAFLLHPAKMDCSTIAAFTQVPIGDDDPFIPVFIERFRAPRPIRGAVHAHVPQPETLAASGDVMHNSYTIRDADGRLLAEFTKLTCKRIRHPELIGRLLADTVGTAGTAEPEAAAPAPAAAEEPTDGRATADHLRAMVAARLGRRPEDVATGSGFYDLGLDSGHMLEMSRELEDLVGSPLYPTLLFEFSDIDSLAAHLDRRHPPADRPTPAAAGPAQQTLPAEAPALHCYRPVWSAAPAAAADGGRGALVLIGADAALAAEVGRLAGGRRTVRVERSDRFARVSAGHYRLDPADRGQLDLLCAELTATGEAPAGYVRFAGPAADDDRDAVPTAHRECSALATAVIGTRPTEPVALLLLHEAAPDGAARPEEAAIAAFARTVTAEAAALRCRAVGYDRHLGADRLAEIVLAEALTRSDESEVRHRGAVREAVRHEQRLLPAAGPAPAPLRERGVYLITGGAGGLGVLLADRLARDLRARLVLTGRSAPSAALAERIRDWRALGAEVEYLPGDIARPADAAAVTAAARARFGRIDGVFHCAGTVRDGMFFRKDEADVAEVLAAKIRGTRNLDAATAQDELDFFALFSSVSATLPNPGQSDYAYANAHLEHFAERRSARRDRPGVTVALGWPYWADGGMQVADDALRRAAADTGLHPLPTELGLDALLGALAGGDARLVLPYGEPGRVAALFRAPTPASAPAPASAPTREAGRPQPADEPVAIIGVAGRYPGAEDLDAFWRNLAEGRDCVTEVPADRWDHEAFFAEEKGAAGRTYSRWGGFLDGVDRFDAAFFGISRREAERMDPQERLFLTTGWRAVEDAGYRPDTLAGGRVGVFAGVMWSHYQLLTDPRSGVNPTALHCSVANRVSYCLDFKGPSMAVDTACSSSLTAIHLAVESLRRGECAAAVAGGVNVAVHPQKYLQLAEGRFLSEDGRCRSFGADGTGYVPGEGVGAVVLKPLSRALADGDFVYAVIRGSSLNHSGRTSGFTVPSPAAQAALIRDAVDGSGLDPATIGCIEAHGTGTSLGDPIEIEGLRSAFADAGLAPGSCAVGSVKSAIGHLESAAGIAAVTKVLLQMKHRRLAPSLHAERLNPHIDFSDTPFHVQRTAEPWTPAPGCDVLRAGVSAFGAGGANAHLLLESAPPADAPGPDGEQPQVFVFSARDEETLRATLRRHLSHLEGAPDSGADSGATALVTAEVARILGVPDSAIDPRETLVDLGVDRVGLAGLTRSLGDRLPAAATPFTGDATIVDIAANLAPRAGGTRGLPPAADVAFTLQTGRVALPVRLAVVATGLDGLRRELTDHLDGHGTGRNRFTGDGERRTDHPAPAPDRLVELHRAGDLHEVARNWAAGADLPWEACHDTAAVRRPRRVPLPVQPFNEQRYWLGEWQQEQQRPAAPAPARPADAAPAAAPVVEPAAAPVVRPAAGPVVEPRPAPLPGLDRDEVVRAVEDALCAELYLERHEIDARQSFHEMGLESVGAVRMTQRLGERFGLSIDPVALFDHPTVPRLAEHLLTADRTAPAPAPAEEPAPAPSRDDIAVIGMSGRFPGAENLDEFWANIVAGRHSFAEVPRGRWAVDPVYDPDRRVPGRTYTKAAAMLPDVDRFDAALFNISPLEAEVMDPQQRLFLQQAWAALDDAGHAVHSAERTRCGVFVGCAPGDYSLLLAEAGQADSGHAFLGTTSSIMPARIGYLLNLVGPTMAVDTACSSSLVAVHLAAESIRRGECSMAVAGGVALMVTPQLHIRASKVGMLSPLGQCLPFDAAADGTVLGEGVGCVVLKRLDRAIADGDHIHGVIRATGINGDGRTNGITAPSARSQAALIAEVHERAGVTAEDIGYVEAHGTGTPLGDPIEVKALTEVFRRTTDRVGYCALGTVKANIGHTTMAAGVAGLLKVLLALRHGELPPAPAFDAPNPKTGLESSPFFVVPERRPWQPGAQGVRMATVSSFGFSGTNAHAVIAEAPRLPAPPQQPDGDHLVVVSARDEAALGRALARLSAALTGDLSLRDVAFTLAVGRSHWPVRIAFVADDLAELGQRLAEAAGGGLPAGCFRGGAAGAEQAPGGSGRRAELERLARAYVSGQDPDWSGLFEGSGARRVPLPAYPFADDRHWVELPQAPADDRHPFVGAPVGSPGTGAGALFEVGVPADHWLLDHHRVGGGPVLPGAASLDLAAASARACGLSGPLELTGVRWLRLVDPAAAADLKVRITATEDGHGFQIGAGDSPEPYVRGGLSGPTGVDRDEVLDLAAIAGRCPGEVPAERFYQDFRSAGIEYGASFRVLARISFNGNEALGRFTGAPARPGFLLDPSLLDGAQQLVAALEAGNDAILVPFAVDTVTVLAPGAVPVWAHVERAGRQRYRVRLADASGRVCVRYEGLSLRARNNPADEMTYRPVWREAAPAGRAAVEAPGRRVAVVHTADAADLAEALAARTGAAVTVALPDAGEADLAPLDAPLDAIHFVARTGTPGVDPERDGTTLALFRLVKRLIAAGRTRDRLELRIVTAGAVPADADDPIVPHAAGLLGIARAVASECPRWRVSCVDVGAGHRDPARTADRIAAEPGTEPLVLLRGDRRLERTFDPVRLPAPEGAAPFRQQGVYVIAGGAGGIGFALSRLLARIAQARLVWLGRSPQGPDHEAKAAEIAALGGRALYLQADVADEAALRRATARAVAEFGAVHGAIHAALDLQDRTIANMDEAAFTAGLAPKVAGITAFARVLGDRPLDFMLVFSSAVSFVEAGGQANYAAASTFEDAYVQWLDRQRPYPVSVVNWGFWGSVGAVANQRMREAFAKLGIGSIEPAEGMAVLRRVIGARLPQTLAMKADRAALPAMGIHVTGDASRTRTEAVQPAAPEAPSAAPAAGGVAVAAVRGYVAGVFSEVLKTPVAGLEPSATFENFGVDSLVSLNIIDRFEQDLGDLPATLLFEHMTIDQLAAHLLAEHGERLTGLLAPAGAAAPAAPAVRPLPVEAPAARPAGTEPAVLNRAREAFAEVEAYSRDLLRTVLHRMAGRPAAGTRVPVAELAARIGVVERHRRLLDAVLDIARADGAVRMHGAAVEFTAEAGRPGPDGAGAELALRHPEMAGHVHLVGRCCEALPEVLAGRRNPMDVLFPKGSVALVEPIYKGQPIADHFNRTLAEEVVAAARRAYERTGRPARVLEIGAGTGSSSATVLPACGELGGDGVHYVYTDISPAFLRHGEREFERAHPFMSFRTLDISKDPLAQGFEAADFDVVFGTHVLHATPDIERTMANIGTLLRPGGIALVNEITRFSDFLTLTFGLTTGWWMYEDGERRLPHSPLLSPEQWARTAESADLAAVRTHGVPGAAAGESAQSLIVVAKPEAAPAAGGDVAAAVRGYVAGVFSEVLKTPVAGLEPSATFENFGVDSLVSLNIIDRFEQDLGDLPATLLFEHMTIDQLAAHLLAEYGDRIPMGAAPEPEPAFEPEPEPAYEPEPEPEPELEPEPIQVSEPVAPEPGAVEPPAMPVAPARSGDIAIIGVAGRFPASPDLDTFWANLSQGRSCITEIPEKRWDWRPHFDERKGVKHRTYNRWGGFLDDVDAFDAPLFGILPREANDIDPQERLFLETCWELLETTGHLGERTRQASTGVFAGVMYGEYGLLAAAADWPEGRYATGHSAFWSMANRVSYTFDLQGPSFAVDSACSSALTAVHLACESLRRGECLQAVAGGVNLILHPAHFAALAARNMLATGDGCRVFDADADGFVPGEGVGAVLLKPVEQAEADGDTIWAVVKGSLSNAGGKVSGYTVPNPNAQAQLIEETLRRSGIHPRTVSYVEAHGTGTALGDPIEVAGLTRAFRSLGVTDPDFCAVGSVKSNIGHLEGAAGIAALAKVLLQFKHRTLAPTINLDTVNPKIRFEGSPFRPQRTATPWERPVADLGTGERTWPLRAGISSFGAGGANVHMILEEYVPFDADGPDGADGATAAVAAEQQVFLLSALSRDALRTHAEQVADFLESPAGLAAPLRDLASTSRTGRRELPERLAVTGSDHAAIAAGLRRFATGDLADGGFVSGTAVKGATSDGPSEDPARDWVRGVPVDWHAFGAADGARKAAFPTYPFERRRHWITGAARPAGPPEPQAESGPTGPVDEVEPTGPGGEVEPTGPGGEVEPTGPAPRSEHTQQAEHPRQEATVDSDQPTVVERPVTHPAIDIARHHRIDGARCVPGVGLLEVARGAMPGADDFPLRMTGIRWLSPVDLDAGVDRVRVALTPQHETGATAFQLSVPAADGFRTAARGVLANDPQATADPALDLAAVRRRCGERRSAKDFYEAFSRGGLSYGRPLRVVAELWIGDSEALARLASAQQTRQSTLRFVLPPTLLDGALQVVSVLCEEESGYLPVGISELRAHGALPMDCWARVREVTPEGRRNGHRRFDIRLTDGDGRVLAALDGLEIAPRSADRPADEAPTAAPVTGGSAAPAVRAPVPTRTRYLRPVWEPAPLAVDPSVPRTVLVHAEDGAARQALVERLAALGATAVTVAEGEGFARTEDGGYLLRTADPSSYEQLVADLAARGPVPDAIVHLAAPRPLPGPDAADTALPAVLWSSVAVLRRPEQPRLTVLYAHTGTPEDVDPLDCAVGGTLRTLALEHSRFRGVRLALPGGRPGPEHADRIVEELLNARAGAQDVDHRDGVRRVKELRPFEPQATGTGGFALRDGGTYLITGGAGAIGLHFARFFAGLDRAATVVLAGRSAVDDRIVEELSGTRTRVVYRRADLRDPEETSALVAGLTAEFGPLHGVIHSAGVSRDARAVRKTPEEVAAVLGPKVAGTVHLDRATAGQPLDFFVLFSSMSAEAGNPGQADYAYANAFLDAFAARRARLVTAGDRSGTTLAVCWPLWEDGGMTVDDATRELFARKWDMVPLSTEAALAAFVCALAAGEPCCAVVEGLSTGQPEAATAAPAPVAVAAAPEPVAGDPEVRESTERRVRLMAAEFLLVDESDVDPRAELLELGFDSITLTELVNKVNEQFGLDLLPTVLFECPDIASFTDYLVEHHRAELSAGQASPEPAPQPQPEPEPVVVRVAATAVEPESEPESESEPTAAAADRPVAVIGMAGVFPGSADVDAFWAHLVAGDDLVRPVPDDQDRAALLADPVARGMRGGFLDAVSAFDARLFGISPNEAALMDPQQRLFLQAVWRSIEDAGYRPSGLAGSRTGIFAGVATHDYDDLLKERGVASEAHAATGIAHSVLPNRVSHLLDLHGPSEAVDTACSSSLVALHRAVRSLREGECELAVAGGVNAILSPGLLRSFAGSGMLSEDGRCKTFDAAADGYVRGEGVGAVVLKPLDRALADGDQIHAVIRGSAVNHGGRSTSLTAPNPEAQARVVAEAVRSAGVAPDTIGYIETHGTGTRLGDPVEIEGLKKAFTQLHAERGELLPGDGRIALGAVKSAIGHTETAAGVAGLLKVLLCMRHRMLPANLHFSEPNPYLRLADTPFRINDRLRPWEPARTADGRPVWRAGVSSFGFGGSNAHVVLEAYEPGGHPADDRRADDRRAVVVPLSAGSPEDLADYAGRLSRHLLAHPEADLARVAHTLRTGRAERPHRCAVSVHDRDELARVLADFAAGGQPAGVVAGTARRGVPAARGDEGTTRLMELWCEGAAVSWPSDGPVPGRLSLPSAPFARTRHWVDSLGRATAEPRRTAHHRPGDTGRATRGEEPPRNTHKETPVLSIPAERPTGPTGPEPAGRGPKVKLTLPTARTAQSAPTVSAPRPPAPAPVAAVAVAESPAPAVAPGADAIATLLRDQLATILGTAAADIGDDVPFAELGLDSIYRMDLARLLNTTYSLDLKAAELYDFDTVAKLSGFVAPLCGPTPTVPVAPVAPVAPAAPPVAAAPVAPVAPAVPAAPAVPTVSPGAAAPAAGDLEELLLGALAEALGRPVDRQLTFTDNGFTSFDMLKSVAALEKQFGALRKTLLFDHPTVAELAVALGGSHGSDAARLLRDGAGRTADPSPAAADGAARSAYRGGALVVEKTGLADRPEIAAVVADLEHRYGREGGLPGRDIAPLIFLGAARTAYFNFSRRGDAMLTWSYVGPTEQMPALAAEYVEYGRAHGIDPNIVSLIRLEEEAGVRFTATPFGALQRLDDITDFSLTGGRMARLRYIIGKFEKAGACRTVEYRVGSDPDTDRAITEMIDQWGQGKEMVNPYVFTVRDEIGRGLLQPRHRMFLTYVDDRMVNAVIVTKIPSEPGYLLDLEFYPQDAPLGGLDYAVVAIIERTAAEGSTVFSFGGSFGAKICESPNAAPEVEAALAELRSRGIFTGDGNFRFKNKFRTTNLPLYLCQPADSARTDVSRLILMIADPTVDAPRPDGVPVPPAPTPAASVPVPVVAAPAPVVPERPAPADEAAARRERLLAAHGWNPLHVPADEVEYDLITDSWAEQSPALTAARTGQLRSRAALLAPGQTLGGIDLLPFSCVLPTPSGRDAEAALCRSWPTRGPVVLHNSVFPTWYFSLLDNGFEPVAVRTAPSGAFRGDLDLAHLAARFAEHAGRIAFCCVEVSTNAQGGAAISLANLTAVRELADRHGVRLVLDATRALDNAVVIAEAEPEHLGRDPFDVVQEILALADAATVSLSKDFGTDTGGIVATDDPEVAHHLRERVNLRGPGVGRSGRALAAAALGDREWAVRSVRERVHRVAALHRRLTDAGVPVVRGAATHCVLLDTARMPQLRGVEHPVPAALAWIYQHTGIRAAAHLSADPQDAGLIRLAVPVGLDDAAADDIADRLTGLFARPGAVRDLLLAAPDAEAPGNAALAHYHPAEHVPGDVREALVEGHEARNETLAVLRGFAPDIEHSLLRLPGGEVEVWSAGAGPVLLMMLPFNIGAGLFGPQFAELTDRHRVIVVHHPGVGATTLADDLSYAGLADLARRVLDELGVREPVHIAGASFGGLVAQTFALRHPGTTASLTLIGSSYKLGNRSEEVNRLAVVVQEDFDNVERRSGSARFAAERARHEEVLLRCESMDPLTGLRYLDVFAAEPDLLGRLGDLAVPTQILQGRHDTVIPLKTAHLLHGLIPDSRYHELADAGHFPSLTSAKEVNELLTTFVAQHTPAAATSPSR
ncbi:SDR family NAD(P)-dependent oxidoreductase [Kitasatospora sp. CB02891]|uniref:SDR family NAD(P)-dependent oxidoreductase n=1 Tax=Kitasatospora sp. CB02891 TaxID=2020329 RepID=UPI0018E1F307|nr:SDR family NAD(P)-dependent oxidoreductase [Kitasatospora sp. CB02891]